ncbi:MAG: hypothetical protein IKZ96_00300 [Bacilli bacterium]|nr:hypothetical protein [Bacilli bacterium]
MDIFSTVSIIEILIFITVIICSILLIKMIINRKKMDKLAEELSHIRKINNIINDEARLEMTLPFNPFM